MASSDEKLTVLCVDDNPDVAEALKIKLSRSQRFEWIGSLLAADTLVETAQRLCPALVLLDLDMPGRDPFDAASELIEHCPSTRVVVFSGHVRHDLVDRALEAGAWGYASKNDGEGELLHVMQEVAAGEVSFSPEVRATYDQL